MKIGYPCINNSLKCSTNSTFRLKSYSEERIKLTIKNNLNCLLEILKFNQQKNLMFFRISSDIIPFASHPINKFPWQKHFEKDFKKIGIYIKENGMRISMHPDQFVLLNALKKEIVKKSIKELEYHCQVLDLMGLSDTAKVQIHVGGIYGDKGNAINRFVENYQNLPVKIKRRLVIENDDRLFSLKDCLYVHEKTNIPIIFDFFHHECLNNNESPKDALMMALKTWQSNDGILMTDYSSQAKGKRKGKHADTIDIKDFRETLRLVKDHDFDVMLEIKDKEKSAIKALRVINQMENEKKK